jgi:hypothetical protein
MLSNPIRYEASIDPWYTQIPISFTRDEASFVHHYTKHLSRWLDCTDTSRQFTLTVPIEAKHCSILRYAVIACAARHRGDDDAAETMHQRCIELLVRRLDETPTTHHDKLLCAINLLCVYEQLSGMQIVFS